MEAGVAIHDRSASARGHRLPQPRLPIPWLGVLAFLGPLLVALPLALDDGGYGLTSRSRVGLLIWWLILLCVALRSGLSGRAFGRFGWAATTCLAGLTVWTLTSALWSSSPERALVEGGRVATVLGAFLLATMVCRAGHARRLASGLGVACVAIVLLALGTRFFPSLAPSQEAAEVFPGFEATLSYPFNYPSALGALAALSVPLLLYQTGARSLFIGAAAAAAIPSVVLAGWLTGSAQALPLCALGAVAYMVLTTDRLAATATSLISVGGGALLILAADDRNAFEAGSKGSLASSQGLEMLGLVLAVGAAVAAYQVAIALATRHARPGRTGVLWRRARWPAVIALVVIGAIAAVAVSLPERAADGWETFKGSTTVQDTDRSSLVTDLSGQNRYQYWSSAVRALESEPLVGIGPGTFEFWWAKDGSETQFIRDAHSLVFETLAELGLVGGLLLAGLFLSVVLGGSVTAIKSPLDRERNMRAAAVGGASVFCASASVDWTWEFGSLGIIFAAMAALALARTESAAEAPEQTTGSSGATRWPLAVVSLSALAVIYVPFATASSLDASRAAAGHGDSGKALELARDAARLEPFAAAPKLQQALILEQLGEFEAALELARQAADSEPENWRNWLVLSRISAEAGNSAEAVAAYRRARSLNPRSPVFS